MDSPVDKVVVMARGLGRRMRRQSPPAPTGTTLDPEQERAADRGAKALMPVGRSFLDHVLTEVADAGFRRVCLVVGPDPDPLREYYGGLACQRLTLEFAVQAKPLGTADAVAAAAEFVGDDAFAVINSDNHYPSQALAALRGTDGPGLIGFTRDGLETGGIPPERISGYAVIEVDANEFLTAIHEKPEQGLLAQMGEPIRVSMNCWRFDSDMVSFCRSVAPSPRGELELTTAVGDAMADGGRFRVVTLHVPVLDLSSRADIGPVVERLRGAEVRL